MNCLQPEIPYQKALFISINFPKTPGKLGFVSNDTQRKLQMPKFKKFLKKNWMSYLKDLIEKKQVYLLLRQITLVFTTLDPS